MNVSRISTQEINGQNGVPADWPANSEGFYQMPGKTSQSIIERIRANPSEQATYLNAVNHEMDEMGARATANGGVMTSEDLQRNREIKTQMGAVMQAFSGSPEMKGFYDSLWFARDRAQKVNPNDRDYLPMAAEEAITYTRNNRPAQEEYLRDIDEELGNLQRTLDSGEADEGTRQSYEYLETTLRKMSEANTEQPFDDELLARMERATAGKNAVPRREGA